MKDSTAAPAFPETHSKAISKNFFTGHPLAHTYGKNTAREEFIGSL